jgi:hypothetical protein
MLKSTSLSNLLISHSDSGTGVEVSVPAGKAQCVGGDE